MKIRVIYFSRNENEFVSAFFNCSKDALDFVRIILARKNAVLFDYRVMNDDEDDGGDAE